MSWTAFKKRLRLGAELRVVNHRQPWRTRDVEIVAKTKRNIVVRDLDAGPQGDMASIKMPPAAFTRSVSADAFEVLAQEDGPRWVSPGVKSSMPIYAGQPVLTLQMLREAP